MIWLWRCWRLGFNTCLRSRLILCFCQPECVRTILRNKWNGPRITFGFTKCPLCKQPMKHPGLRDLTDPLDENKGVDRSAYQSVRTLDVNMANISLHLWYLHMHGHIWASFGKIGHGTPHTQQYHTHWPMLRTVDLWLGSFQSISCYRSDIFRPRYWQQSGEIQPLFCIATYHQWWWFWQKNLQDWGLWYEPNHHSNQWQEGVVDRWVGDEWFQQWRDGDRFWPECTNLQQSAKNQNALHAMGANSFGEMSDRMSDSERRKTVLEQKIITKLVLGQMQTWEFLIQQIPTSDRGEGNWPTWEPMPRLHHDPTAWQNQEVWDPGDDARSWMVMTIAMGVIVLLISQIVRSSKLVKILLSVK